MSGSLRNIIGLGRSGGGALRALQSDARGLKSQLRDVGSSIQGASGNVTALVNRERELNAALAATNRGLEQQRRLLAIDANAGAMRARGQAMVGQGQQNIIGGATLAAPILLAVRAGADFSTLMVDIQQKANLSDRATAGLARNIMAAARAAHQMPNDMGEAINILSGKGLDPRQAARMVPAIGRLGTAMRVELADGAAAAYANMQNMRVPIGQTARALDIMAASGNMGAFEIRDMARWFPPLTAQMQALGNTGLRGVGQLSAALQMAERGTGNADQAANNVQNLLAKINSPGTIRAFERNFGINLPAAMARLKAQGMDTFEAIATVTRDATHGDLSRIGFAFEDMQAQGAVRSLIQNLEDYKRVRDAAMQGSGTVDRAFDQRVLRDANVSWTAFKGSMASLAITAGTTLLPALTQVANSLNSGLQWLSRWAQANPQTTATILKLVGGLAAMRIGLGAAQIAIGSLFGPLATAYRLFARAREISLFSRMLGGMVNGVVRFAPMLMRGFTIMRTAAMFLARGLMQAGMMMLANPVILVITLIVIAIAAAAYLIYTNWDTIKAAFASGVAMMGRAWVWVKNNFQLILSYMGPLGVAANFVINHWGTIKAAFMGAITYLGGMVSRFVQIGRWIIDGLVNGIRAAPGKVWNAIRNIVSGALDGARNMLGINSPSRVFMAMGGHITSGLALGIDRGGAAPLASLHRIAAGMGAGLSIAASPFAATAASASGIGGSGGGSGGTGNSYHYTINLSQQPGQDGTDMARQIMAEIERINASRARGSYDDR